MTTWKNFLIRASSALVALALIIALYYFWAVEGLKAAVSFAAVVGTWELSRILFNKESSTLLRAVFYVLCLVVFAMTTTALSSGLLALALAQILFVTFVLLQSHDSKPLEDLLITHAKAALGFVYMGLLPAFSYKILQQSQGTIWFVFLLAAVFAGDTLAYIFGVLLGKHKIMPSVSPKKSWEGSVGGLLGSTLAGLLCWLFLFPEHPLWIFLILALIAGFFGQFGDFFESLIKRVAGVKDSGKIMPGHGGILDRIDGVLFASPVILSGILILSHLLS